MLLLRLLYVFGFVELTRAHTPHSPMPPRCVKRALYPLYPLYPLCLGMPIARHTGTADAAHCAHVNCTLKCRRFDENAVFDRAPEARPIIMMVNTITCVVSTACQGGEHTLTHVRVPTMRIPTWLQKFQTSRIRLLIGSRKKEDNIFL